MATNFWSGDKAQFLLNKLKLKSGTQIISTDTDPKITSIDADKGSIAEFNGKWFKKNDDGDTTRWTPLVGFEDPSIYTVFNAEEGDITDFVNITINTTTPMSGDADYSVTSFPAELPPVVLDPIRVNAAHGSVTLYTSLTSGTAQVVVYDQDSNPVKTATIEAGTAQRTRLEWFPKTTDVDYTLVFEDVSSATGLTFDSVVFSDSPREVKEFVYLTEWESYTPVIDSFGSISSNDSFYRRVGDTLEVTIEFSSGTHTASEARFYLPSGLTIDSLKVPTQTVVGNLSSSYESPLVTNILALGGNNYLTLGRDDNSDSGLSNQNGNVIGNSVDVSLFAKIPIQGWKATKEGTVYASDRVSGEIYVEGSGATILPVTANVTDINFSEVEDTHSIWNGTQATIPDTGVYTISGTVIDATTTNNVLYAYIDGVSVSPMSSNTDGDTGNVTHFEITRKFNEGDVVSVRSNNNLTLVNTADHQIYITKASSNYDNLIVDVGTKHVSGGEEYLTKDTFNGKPIYARTWIVGSDVTVSGNVITGLPTNITPFGLNNYTSDYWLIYESGFSTSLSRVDYRKSSGVIYAEFSGTRKVGAGTVIYFPYTYDD